MESRTKDAIARHMRGYNCAQAVVCTYCDLFGVDEQTAYRLSEGFGLGMGTQGTCGAMSGALMLASLKNSGGIENAGATKGSTYGIARELTADFAAQAGSTQCAAIKSPPVIFSCGECIEAASAWVEKHLL